MKKITIALLFCFISVSFVNSQIVTFDFNADPYLEVTNSNQKITVSELTLSSGTISANVTTGTYFTDEPYIQESGGWGALDELMAKYFYIDIVAVPGYCFSISNIRLDAYTTSAGPSIISIFIDNNQVSSNDIGKGDMQLINQQVSGLDRLTHITLKILGWNNGSRATTGSGILKLDNLIIDGLVKEIPQNDNSSIIFLTQFDVPNHISSLINTPQLVPIMEFALLDSASGDGLNTIIDSLVFQIDTSSFASWGDVLDDVKLFSTAFADTIMGRVDSNTVTFITDGLFEVLEGASGSDTCRLLINLKSLLPNIDGKHLGFVLDSSNVYCNSLGSKVGRGLLKTDSDRLEIQVDAIKLNVVIDELPLWKDSTFSILIKAVDTNGNIDRDEFGEVELELMDGDNSVNADNIFVSNFNQGICSFSNLTCGVSDTILIKISSAGFNDYLIEDLLVAEHLFYDNFESGTLIKWSNTDDWLVSSQEIIDGDFILKHNRLGVGGKSYIVTEYQNTNMNYGKVVWRLALENGDFDPTSSNKFWYYIMASEDNLISHSVYGYAVGVNLSGSTDTLSLWKIDKLGAKTKILQTDFDWEPNSSVNIEILRDPMGFWQMGYSTDPTFDDLKYTTKAADNTFVNLPYHGLVYQYSSTRSGLLWCDNIYVGMVNTAPKLISVKGVLNNVIELQFSEPLNQTGVELMNNYSIRSGIDNEVLISEVVFNSLIPSKALLKVNRLITASYIVEVLGLLDTEGYEMQSNSMEFFYTVTAQPFDVVINEIMFDAYPIVDLPDADYIEIYNCSTNPINLKGWQIDIDGVGKYFPDTIIEIDEYVIITSLSEVANFTYFGKTIGIISATALTNTGKTLKLISDKGITIDSILYNPQWITDNEKQDGGWSLEQIDYDNHCGYINNWEVSVSMLGGTPGSINSVYAQNIDNYLPKVEQVLPINCTTVVVQFSEPIIEGTDVGNFKLNANQYPDSIFANTFDASNMICIFNHPFGQNSNNSFSITNISDYCSNIITDTIIHFTYYNPQLYDVVINEIMANPTPTIGLPDIEYIEIYNNSQVDIDIYKWLLKVNSSIRELPDFTVLANSYTVLCDIDNVIHFSDEVKVQGVNDFTILPLSGSIALINSSNRLICKTNYTSSWIIDDFKADGGFSLERIDYDNPDETSDNWQVSNNEKGGTPGFENSIFENSSDDTPPNVLRAFPVNDTVIGLQFSEAMDIYAITSTMVEFDNETLVQAVSVLDYNLSILYLHLNKRLLVGVEYAIEVNDGVTDIAGNSIINNRAKVMLPTKASANDVVINEVLFNSHNGGVDFVELYNRSAFTVNLKQFIVASFDDVGNIKNPKTITEDGLLLFPSSYVVLSENSESLKEKYWIEDNFAFMNMNSLPTLSNSEGSVVVMDTNGVVIDYMYYTDDMHFGLINDTKGVSLERVDYDRSPHDRSNWHSASEHSGWATPGYINSMYSSTGNGGGVITIEPEAFSPDSDGFDDVLYMRYRFDTPGNVAKVSIFDKAGRLIVVLANNELMSADGVLSWDGLDSNNRKVPIGIYVIYVEVFDMNGNVKKYRRVCAVNARFD